MLILYIYIYMYKYIIQPVMLYKSSYKLNIAPIYAHANCLQIYIIILKKSIANDN